ncbi:hypothetical protein CXB51_012791 [Gossypium anomalum]|uniref:Uncharacterized protein n=1 Tax=Gossypium anomalum TaxID=47600 RepID=A0A8J5YXB2_9ROSI|nr:hypothetical protein CXB51_012791 [Gossypium anomalum]
MELTATIMKPVLYSCLLFSFWLLSFLSFCEAADRQAGLHGSNPSTYSPVCIEPQDGKMEADEIDALPGQPDGVDFDQYAGYVTVDQKAGRALFYYFVESPRNSSSNNPLILWLNGGPGCSSLGYGAMSELGPLRSNTSSDYDNAGDTTTAIETYTFPVNWLERFPQYKSRLFSSRVRAMRHYVPQLASTILYNNENTNQTVINLKGIAVGNGLLDEAITLRGIYDNFWTHALNSDETYKGIHKYCDFANDTVSEKCFDFTGQADDEIGDIDIYNIYAPICLDSSLKNGSHGSVHDFDPCTDYYVENYLNIPEVQNALHANQTEWTHCRDYAWTDRPPTILPILKNIIQSGVSVWIYSGDKDGRVPVAATGYSLIVLKLGVKKGWHAWYSEKEIGGYVVEYEGGLALVTVRGAGHLVPSNQPQRALTFISSFLQGTLPPSTP